MDHYKVLGLERSAGKEEIKEAFRKLAMQFHPDKHPHSPKSLREDAVFRFKLVSEAYEVLMDDGKRADYNMHLYNNRNNDHDSNRRRSHSTYGYGYNPRSEPKSSHGYYGRAANGDGFVPKFEIALRFLTTRSFLLNFAFASVLLGGIVIIDTSRDALWKLHNPGKSFEDAVESIEKSKA